MSCLVRPKVETNTTVHHRGLIAGFKTLGDISCHVSLILSSLKNGPSQQSVLETLQPCQSCSLVQSQLISRVSSCVYIRDHSPSGCVKRSTLRFLECLQKKLIWLQFVYNFLAFLHIISMVVAYSVLDTKPASPLDEDITAWDDSQSLRLSLSAISKIIITWSSYCWPNIGLKNHSDASRVRQLPATSIPNLDAHASFPSEP